MIQHSTNQTILVTNKLKFIYFSIILPNLHSSHTCIPQRTHYCTNQANPTNPSPPTGASVAHFRRYHDSKTIHPSTTRRFSQRLTEKPLQYHYHQNVLSPLTNSTRWPLFAPKYTISSAFEECLERIQSKSSATCDKLKTDKRTCDVRQTWQRINNHTYLGR